MKEFNVRVLLVDGKFVFPEDAMMQRLSGEKKDRDGFAYREWVQASVTDRRKLKEQLERGVK